MISSHIQSVIACPFLPLRTSNVFTRACKLDNDCRNAIIFESSFFRGEGAIGEKATRWVRDGKALIPTSASARALGVNTEVISEKIFSCRHLSAVNSPNVVEAATWVIGVQGASV
jgi:hypothetical protein